MNRSIQSTAKAIKGQLEGLSHQRANMPEPQQAKLTKLIQDFAATLQVRAAGGWHVICCACTGVLHPTCSKVCDAY